MMSGLSSSDRKHILIRFCVIVGIVIVISICVVLGMGTFNRTRAVEQITTVTEEEEYYSAHDSLWSSTEGLALPEIEALPEGPEASWEVNVCSIFVTESSETVIDSLPVAPIPSDKPLEALFLVRRWAEECGMGAEDIEQVYVFTKLDTIYVDLPTDADIGGLKRTIESRFICFTRLFPLAAGCILSSYPEGLSLRGVKGVFRE